MKNEYRGFSYIVIPAYIGSEIIILDRNGQGAGNIQTTRLGNEVHHTARRVIDEIILGEIC